jgi:hypothetical protein
VSKFLEIGKLSVTVLAGCRNSGVDCYSHGVPKTSLKSLRTWCQGLPLADHETTVPQTNDSGTFRLISCCRAILPKVSSLSGRCKHWRLRLRTSALLGSTLTLVHGDQRSPLRCSANPRCALSL